jgi:hypothetical protein
MVGRQYGPARSRQYGEDVSSVTTPVNDLADLAPSHVSIALLAEQAAYFVLVDHYSAWINYEGRHKAGKIARGFPNKPVLPPPPPLTL